MTVLQGPPTCKEYIPINNLTMGVCNAMLPCSRKHATPQEVAAWKERIEEHIAGLQREYQRLLREETGR